MTKKITSKKQSTKGTSKKVSNTMRMAVVGAGLAGLAATAYFFLGPKGKAHQKHLKAWAIKMKGDVVEKMEVVKEMSQPIYNEIIDSVATKYATSKDVSKVEIAALAQDLKKHWKAISSGAKLVKKA